MKEPIKIKIVFKIILLFIALLQAPISSYATQQIPDTVRYQQLVFSWYGKGLTAVLDARNIKFEVKHTACWDGHIAGWEIRDGKLFLIKLKAWIKAKGSGKCEIKEVGLNYLFPGTGAVFAKWFTGEMVLLEKEGKVKKDLTAECIYWIFSVDSGTIKSRKRLIETFDFNDEQQLRKYVSLFNKFPNR